MDIQYNTGDLSICVHDVYRVTTCRPGRGIPWRPPTYSLLETTEAAAVTLQRVDLVMM